MRVKPEHRTVILDFCEKHPQLITNIGPVSKSNFENLWKQLCTSLNSLGQGEKTVIQWKKALIDWKFRTKAKAAAINTYEDKSGDGENISLTLSEKRLLEIMSKTAEGDASSSEIGFRKRKLKESDSNRNANRNEIIVQIQGSNTKNNKRITIPFYKMVPVPTDIREKIEGSTKSTIQTSDKKEHIISQPQKKRKLQVKDILIEENKQILNVLNNINENISCINKNFEKLVNLLEKKYNG